MVELIGGIEPARTFILKAIAAGKHVVTANKALISQHGKEIFDAAAATGVEVGFEASVGGGIPVIKALKEGLVANRILSIMGIMNGTANYILTKMTDEGIAFDEVLKEAQALGFAEADPTYDIEGIDTAHKLAILMTIAYGMSMSNSRTFPSRGSARSNPSTSTLPAIRLPDQTAGHQPSTMATMSRPGSIRPWCRNPTCWPISTGPITASISPATWWAMSCFYGQGAGKMPTGSAVAADVVDIARNIAPRFGQPGAEPSPICPRRSASRPITPMSELLLPLLFPDHRPR